jgi:hypothetical protein
MSKKNTIRLTETELRNMIAESVRSILKEAEVTPGITSWRDVSHDADEYAEYDSISDESEYVNDQVPDFVLTLANRLEKQIFNKIILSFPDFDNDFSKVRVHAELNQNKENGQSLKTSSTSIRHEITFDISWDLCSSDKMRYVGHGRETYRLHNKIKSIVAKVATMMLGNMEGARVRLNNDNYSDDSLRVTVVFDEYESWYGDDYNFRKTHDNTSALFRNNPARQIPGRRK